MTGLLSKVERILILGWTNIGTGRVCRGDLHKEVGDELYFCSLGWVMELSLPDQEVEDICVRYLSEAMSGEPASEIAQHNRTRIIRFNDTHDDAAIAHAWFRAIDAVKRDINEGSKETGAGQHDLVGSAGSPTKSLVEGRRDSYGDGRRSLSGSEYRRVTRH